MAISSWWIYTFVYRFYINTRKPTLVTARSVHGFGDHQAAFRAVSTWRDDRLANIDM